MLNAKKPTICSPVGRHCRALIPGAAPQGRDRAMEFVMPASLASQPPGALNLFRDGSGQDKEHWRLWRKGAPNFPQDRLAFVQDQLARLDQCRGRRVVKGHPGILNLRTPSMARRGLVLFVHDYPPLGGGGLARHVLDTSAALSAAYETRIVTSRMHDHFADDRNGCLSARPDIEALSPWISGLPRLLRLLAAAQVVVCNTTYSLRPLATLVLTGPPSLLRKTIVVTHTEPAHVDHNRFGHLPTTLRRASTRLHDALCRRARATEAFSEAECARLRQGGNERAEFLPMILHFPSAYTAILGDRTRSPRPGRVVGFAGELSTLKGFDRALRLLDYLPASATMLVAGDGPLRAEAERRVLERVPGTAGLVLAGPMRPEEMAGFYRAIDVLVVPSRTESLGRVALEAMACGVGVLGSPVGGLAELLTRNVGPEALVDFDHPVVAARAVTDLLNNRDLRLRRAVTVHRRVLSFYDRLPERWLALVAQVAEGRGARCA